MSVYVGIDVHRKRQTGRFSLSFGKAEHLSRGEIDNPGHAALLGGSEHVPGAEQVRRNDVSRAARTVMSQRAGVNHRGPDRLPKVAASKHVQERHEGDKTEDPPGQLPARSQVGPVGGQVDPHQHNGDGMEETDQNLKELLHPLYLPRLG
jgi:hypothetical protein